MPRIKYRRHVLALTDDELESFVRSWTQQKVQLGQYDSCQNFSGPGDMGRDVVGFLSQEKHEGGWHNYQCKQYNKPLPASKAILDIGKIFYYASIGMFTAPEQIYFVAPKGVSRELSLLINNPSKFKTFFIENWDKYCKENITQKEPIPLTQSILSLVNNFSFSNITAINLDEMLDEQAAIKILNEWFDYDPGPAPQGVVPETILSEEMNYIMQLLDAYGDSDGKEYTEIGSIPHYKSHLAIQRERFFDAESFKRFYRDNTQRGTLDSLERDIFFGVIDTCNSGGYDNKLKCLEAVMKQASSVAPSGILAKHARVPVKQGICHHFANEDKIKWKR